MVAAMAWLFAMAMYFCALEIAYSAVTAGTTARTEDRFARKFTFHSFLGPYPVPPSGYGPEIQNDPESFKLPALLVSFALAAALAHKECVDLVTGWRVNGLTTKEDMEAVAEPNPCLILCARCRPHEEDEEDDPAGAEGDGEGDGDGAGHALSTVAPAARSGDPPPPASAPADVSEPKSAAVVTDEDADEAAEIAEALAALQELEEQAQAMPEQSAQSTQIGACTCATRAAPRTRRSSEPAARSRLAPRGNPHLVVLVPCLATARPAFAPLRLWPHDWHAVLVSHQHKQKRRSPPSRRSCLTKTPVDGGIATS